MIVTALVAGLQIGFEREVQHKNAGLKTKALVCNYLQRKTIQGLTTAANVEFKSVE